MAGEMLLKIMPNILRLLTINYMAASHISSCPKQLGDYSGDLQIDLAMKFPASELFANIV